MRVHLLDPPAFTPPYDAALAAALARAGADVTLHTSRFGYGEVAEPEGVRVEHRFYRRELGPPGSRRRRLGRLLQHGPDMLSARSALERRGGVAHFQWLAVQHVDGRLLPRTMPLVLTAHDVLPREPRRGQRDAQRRLYAHVDAVVVHSEHGRRRLVDQLGVPEAKVHRSPHGAFVHLTRPAAPGPLPAPLAAVPADVPVVLLFGLLRPYKGIDVALEAWRGLEGAELWVVGRPMMDVERLREQAPPGVRIVPRFVPDAELPALFARASLAVLPYREIDQSGVLFTALAFGTPMVLSDVGGFPEVAATGAAQLVPAGDPVALRSAVQGLLASGDRREAMAAAARAAADGPFSWDRAAERHLALYRALLGER